MKKSASRLKRSPARSRPERWLVIGQIAAILLVTVIAYLPSLRGGFVWDDELLISKNPLLQTWSGLGEIWAFGRTPDYVPLTNTLHWLEWHWFGLASFGYHLVNLVIHIGDALLLWLVLRRLALPGAWLAGLIFAVHPVHVESVAWISEARNVVSMFWALISFLFFQAFVERRTNGATLVYVFSLIAFVLAMLSKAQVVFLPVALALCMWWRLARPSDQTKPARRLHDVLMATIPFFAIAVALGLVTVAFQNRGLGGEEVMLGGMTRRFVNGGMALWWYIGKLVAPVRLMAVYPNWRFDGPRWFEWLPALGLGAVVGLMWLWRDRGARGPLIALSCFIVALGPVLGFVRMAYARSGTIVADHLQYHADVFLIALLSAGIGWWWMRSTRRARPLVVGAASVLLISMSIYTWSRAAVYRDEETLWADNLSKNPNAWQAHNRLGQIYFDRGSFAEALPHFEQTVRFKPELADNHNQLGLVYCRVGRFEQGIAEYRDALRLKESNPGTSPRSSIATIRTNLANALTITANNMTESEASAVDPARQREAMQRYREAIDQYEQALSLDPNHPAIHRNLGMLLVRLGRYREAADHLRKVLEIVPNEPNARELLRAIEEQEPARP